MYKISIGQEVEAYCRKCKNDTLHIITAIDDNKIEKVMCKICLSYHKYKKPTGETQEVIVLKTTAKPAPKAPKRMRRDKWARLLDDSDSASAIEYTMERTYELENTIHHKIFGLGVVKNIIDEQKIAVLFHDGQKILVQNLNR